MESLPRETSAACSPPQRAIPERTPLPKAHVVAVIFKEHRYDTSGQKTWLFTNIHRVEVVHGRLHLTRDGYGLVFDAPCEEVEQVYVEDQDTCWSVAQA